MTCEKTNNYICLKKKKSIIPLLHVILCRRDGVVKHDAFLIKTSEFRMENNVSSRRSLKRGTRSHNNFGLQAVFLVCDKRRYLTVNINTKIQQHNYITYRVSLGDRPGVTVNLREARLSNRPVIVRSSSRKHAPPYKAKNSIRLWLFFFFVNFQKRILVEFDVGRTLPEGYAPHSDIV